MTSCIVDWLCVCGYGYLCLDIVSIIVMTARDDIMHCGLVVCL